MIIQKEEYLIDRGSASPAFSFVLTNCASGRVHVKLYLDFSMAYPQKGLTCWRKKISGYDGIIFAVGTVTVNS